MDFMDASGQHWFYGAAFHCLPCRLCGKDGAVPSACSFIVDFLPEYFLLSASAQMAEAFVLQ